MFRDGVHFFARPITRGISSSKSARVQVKGNWRLFFFKGNGFFLMGKNVPKEMDFKEEERDASAANRKISSALL